MNYREAKMFWSWFEENATVVRDALDSGKTWAVVEPLESHLRRAIPDARWELGPFGGDDLFFALSLRGSIERLNANREFVEMAPSVAGWHFLPSKPRKEWSRRVAYLRDVELDFDEWFFRVSGTTVEFDPSGDEHPELSDSQLESACWLFLDFELGELACIRAVDRVTLVRGVRDERARDVAKRLERR